MAGDQPTDPARRAVLAAVAAAAAVGTTWWMRFRWPGRADAALPPATTTTTTEPATTTTSEAPTTTSTPTTTTTEPVTTTTTEPATTTTTEPVTTTSSSSTTTSTTEPVTTTTTEPVTTTSSSSTSTTVATGGVVLDVVSKGEWGARPVGTGFVSHGIARLTLHHTAGALTDNARAPGHWAGAQSWHLQQGWPDIAYHFGVDLAGNVYQGRDPAYRGDTFTEYDPSGHFLVCCMGDYDAAAPPAAMLEGAARIFAWASGRFGVAASTLTGHRDHAATTCPGANLHAQLGWLRSRIAEHVAAGGVTLTY